MFGIHIPHSAGEPIWWWLFWFCVAMVVYVWLLGWLYRVARRAARKPEPRQSSDPPRSQASSGQ